MPHAFESCFAYILLPIDRVTLISKVHHILGLVWFVFRGLYLFFYSLESPELVLCSLHTWFYFARSKWYIFLLCQKLYEY